MYSTDFEARKAIINKLGGDTVNLTNIFQCELVILALYGGDPHNASNIFEADKLILSLLGGDPTKVNTVFEARKAIITRLGGSTVGISNNYEASLTHFELAGGEIPEITYYSVVFKNWDGTVLYTTNVVEGHTPIYNGNIPTRPSDEQYNYTFNGWTPSLGPVYGNIEYTASYTATEIPVEPVYYTVVFKNWDGTVLQTSSVEEGQTAVYNGSTPIRPSDEQYDYTFNGWLPSLGPVYGNIEYTALYTATAIPEPEPNIYTIKFINWNGDILQTVQVEEGQTPVYTGEIPTRPSDEQYDYTFNGWLPAITEASQDITYTALYTATEINVPNCVTFTAEEAGSTLGLNKLGSVHTLEYSTDAQSWTPMTTSTTITLANINDKAYVRGMLSSNLGYSDKTNFKMTGKIAASGNCNAIWNYQNLEAPLKEYCGNGMFYNCTSLTQAPELPATTLAPDCYCFMFLNTSLTQAPELPATTLTSFCYNGMFRDCTSLTQAPELSAMNLAGNCYNFMFSGCTSLTQAPELPATILATACYQGMFLNCTALTQSPELPATTLATRCYKLMFFGCSSLTSITCLATDISATDALQEWTIAVNGTGTFYKAAGVEWPSSTSGIPSSWTVVEIGGPSVTNYVTFTAEEAGSTIGLNKLSTNQTLEYSTDTTTWNTMNTTTSISLTNVGDEVYVRGILSANNSMSNYTRFKMTGKIAASGNCNAIWNYQDLEAALKTYCGYSLFDACSSLTQAPELPATTLVNMCYYYMFYNCTNLSSIKCLATDISVSNAYGSWTKGVASSGTFYKAAGVNWPTGTSGIPSGWTVVEV